MTASVSEPPSPQVPNRRQLKAEREGRSFTWRVIYWLGSLQLALILLATIAVACAIATFAESGFNTKIAQAYIYKAPWFLVWLGVLCINLLAVTITRWPWQKKHIGFVITHYGIITLLAGAVVGMKAGFEGNVTLRKDAPPVTRVTTSRSVVQIESPADRGGYYLASFDAETARLGLGRTRTFTVPGTDLKIVADEKAAHLVQEEKLVASDVPEAAPAVRLRLSSQMMGQTIELPLILQGGQPDKEDFFGLAHISLLPKLSEPSIAPPRETRMIFAKFAPVVSGPISTNVTVQLSEKGDEVSILGPDGRGSTYKRADIVGKPVTEGDAVVTVETYWPDFVMQNGQPSTKSPLPNNPAILVHLSPSTAKGPPTLELAVQDNAAVSYQLLRGGAPYAQGTVEPGESFSTGWADWQAEIAEAYPKAVALAETVPDDGRFANRPGGPGFRAHLVSGDGDRGPDRWVSSGQAVTLTEGTNFARIGYGLETKPLPFSLRLLKFEVPRDEGTNTPADFRATVEFTDPATGATKTGVARMNHPASFPGTFWAGLTGFNYKFSQAEWNPENLDQTTLQVLYDPGWLLKWVGSLAICIGIGLMFYWKPGQAS